ncbi:MAG TPA: hypothetical protein VHN99_09645 [Deinococcales bacterium]|nr:hypothetical protein [Deinococcales bacterium]
MRNPDDGFRFEDYTLVVTERPEWDSFEAELLEFGGLKAGAPTREEALRDLRRLFEERLAYLRAAEVNPPEPGGRLEVAWPSTARVDGLSALARDLFTRVIGLDYDQVWISDESCLSDFGEEDACWPKLEVAYGLRREDLPPFPYIWQVLEAIRARNAN